MWKFKNRKKPLEERIEPTAIIERQSVDVDGNCNGDGGSDVDKQNNGKTIALGEEQLEELQAEQYTATPIDTKKHDADTASADRIFAKALTDLSLNDRTAIEDEIHGVSCMAVEETPHLLEHSLIDFESELHKINPKPAYDKAQQLLLVSSRESSRCYINESKFRLRFLRCELFNVQKAAERFVRYLDFVAEIYGEYALQRPICMNDFSLEEMSLLREGKCQLLPYRDQSGRRIMVSNQINLTEF